jgi:hypothetical protein
MLGWLTAKTHSRTRQAQCGPLLVCRNAGRPRPPRA